MTLNPSDIPQMDAASVRKELQERYPGIALYVAALPDATKQARLGRAVLSQFAVLERQAAGEAALPPWAEDVMRLVELGRTARVGVSNTTGSLTVEDTAVQDDERDELRAHRNALAHELNAAQELVEALRDDLAKAETDLASELRGAEEAARVHLERVAQDREAVKAELEALQLSAGETESALRARIEALEGQIRRTPRFDTQTHELKQDHAETLARVVEFVQRQHPDLAEELRDGLAHDGLRESIAVADMAVVEPSPAIDKAIAARLDGMVMPTDLGGLLSKGHTAECSERLLSDDDAGCSCGLDALDEALSL